MNLTHLPVPDTFTSKWSMCIKYQSLWIVADFLWLYHVLILQQTKGIFKRQFSQILHQTLQCNHPLELSWKHNPISWSSFRFWCQNEAVKLVFMWRQPALWRDKYHRPWPDAARNARRLVRTYNIFRSWSSTANNLAAHCAFLTITDIWKQPDYVETVCSSIRRVFTD